eukprot:CAMPEP_0168406672 /NCGR_PEP_ID=MMETSP0228-20121227/25771_1 /TAXON_ID=133427 /ORGANISM="Protoceratium reticulatum, Strain CCCM 535 (=CCMP 1889)" /LENGTH=98 /DNA_ID=CAMNT_0008420325 /DNA_START=42 /DNA_END=334 /DNA_ORIENTATION=-
MLQRLAGPATRSQCRTGVFSAGVGGHAGSPLKALRREVETRFAEVASGRPLNVSTAQLVELLFEVGAVDAKRTKVGDVIDKLAIHGFHGQPHPEKRDS